MTPEEKAVIVEVLCGQALADHLGDVRDEEDKLWGLLGVARLDYMHPAWDSGEAWPVTRARLEAAGLSLPDYLLYLGDDE